MISYGGDKSYNLVVSTHICRGAVFSLCAYGKLNLRLCYGVGAIQEMVLLFLIKKGVWCSFAQTQLLGSMLSPNSRACCPFGTCHLFRGFSISGRIMLLLVCSFDLLREFWHYKYVVLNSELFLSAICFCDFV